MSFVEELLNEQLELLGVELRFSEGNERTEGLKRFEDVSRALVLIRNSQKDDVAQNSTLNQQLKDSISLQRIALSSFERFSLDIDKRVVVAKSAINVSVAKLESI